MADINHVLEGLACLKEPYEVPDEDCEACHYNSDSCPYDIAGDAYELLKKQVPVTIEKILNRVFGVVGGVCPNCQNWVPSPQSFCGWCGQAVKWE